MQEKCKEMENAFQTQDLGKMEGCMAVVNNIIIQVSQLGVLTYMLEQTDIQLDYPDEYAKGK